jgi:hypothetical protein
MRQWPLVLLFLYVAALVGLAVPGLLQRFDIGVQPENRVTAYTFTPYWIWVLLMILCQTCLFAIPVAPTVDWPLTRRSIFLPVFLTGLMVVGLMLGAFYSLLEFFLGERTLHEDLQVWCWRYPLLAGAAMWVGWAAVFFYLGLRRDPEAVLHQQIRLVRRACILQLMVSLPVYLIVRARTYTYAGLLTSFGIGFGLSVMLFAFGPGVLFLYMWQWRDYHEERLRRLDRLGDAGEHFGAHASLGEPEDAGPAHDALLRVKRARRDRPPAEGE